MPKVKKPKKDVYKNPNDAGCSLLRGIPPKSFGGDYCPWCEKWH